MAQPRELWRGGAGWWKLWSTSRARGARVALASRHAQGLRGCRGQGGGRKGKGRQGGSPTFWHGPAAIPAWAAVIAPRVPMKGGGVGLPKYQIHPSPAAAGYGYPTDKGGGGRGSPNGDAVRSTVLSSPPQQPGEQRPPPAWQIRSEPAGKKARPSGTRNQSVSPVLLSFCNSTRSLLSLYRVAQSRVAPAKPQPFPSARPLHSFPHPSPSRLPLWMQGTKRELLRHLTPCHGLSGFANSSNPGDPGSGSTLGTQAAPRSAGCGRSTQVNPPWPSPSPPPPPSSPALGRPLWSPQAWEACPHRKPRAQKRRSALT